MTEEERNLIRALKPGKILKQSLHLGNELHFRTQIRVLSFHVLPLSMYLSCLIDEILKPLKGTKHHLYVLLLYMSNVHKMMMIVIATTC